MLHYLQDLHKSHGIVAKLCALVKRSTVRVFEYRTCFQICHPDCLLCHDVRLPAPEDSKWSILVEFLSVQEMILSGTSRENS